MKDYGAHSFGQQPPDVSLQHHAIDVTKLHPYYLEASAQVYCEPTVFFLEGEQLNKVRRRIPEVLHGLEQVIVVSFVTSLRIPQPLAGAGKSYDFILHRESMEILDVTIGSWRS